MKKSKEGKKQRAKRGSKKGGAWFDNLPEEYQKKWIKHLGKIVWSMRKIPTNTYAKIAKSLMKDSSFEQYHGSAEDQAKNFASCLMFDDVGFLYDGEDFEI